MRTYIENEHINDIDLDPDKLSQNQSLAGEITLKERMSAYDQRMDSVWTAYGQRTLRMASPQRMPAYDSVWQRFPAYANVFETGNRCGIKTSRLGRKFVIVVSGVEQRSSDTILSKRTSKNIPFGRQEILLLLRAYQVHPCSWAEVISEIQENKNQLPSSTRNLYNTATISQLKGRLSTNLSKRMKESSDDAEIRSELNAVKKMETQHMTKTKDPTEGGATEREESRPTPGPSSASASVNQAASVKPVINMNK
ncbi:uncharacterized protein LOC117322668 [Pecten maximus]|uniref:uncharacterized protein LOC117322668 n=1 Tax=Pecten maximus TaxID=6579 RepID=UPI0014588F31|nr:uncharacterized protein LOC117322668 [Pecten maximus]